MARPLRIERVGGRYHATARGNERRNIFRDDTDLFHFLENLRHQVEEIEGFECRKLRCEPYASVYNATSFTMYLEFKPTGSSSMWVPLRKVSWHWAGSAVLTSGTWALESWSTQSVTLNEETEDYPLWHKVIGPINCVLDEQ